MASPEDMRKNHGNYSPYKWFRNGNRLPEATTEELVADEAWRAEIGKAAMTEVLHEAEVASLEQPIAIASDATPGEVLDFLVDLNREENAGAARNKGKFRIHLGLTGHHAEKAGYITYKQLSMAMEELEQREWRTQVGVSDEPAPHERDWAERAAHDRFDD